MASIMLENPTQSRDRRPATYSPDILPLLQSLLATLADIDFEFEKDLETVTASTVDASLKRKSITKLKQRHRERRTPYLREITALQQRIEETFACKP